MPETKRTLQSIDYFKKVLTCIKLLSVTVVKQETLSINGRNLQQQADYTNNKGFLWHNPKQAGSV